MAALTTTLLVSLAIAQGASQVQSARAEKRAGKAGRRAAESQADLAEWNATQADTQAKDAVAVGEGEVSLYRQRLAQVQGQQTAGFASQGVEAYSGSAGDVRRDTDQIGERDILTLRTNAAREAWGHKVNAEDLRRRAQIAREEGVMLEAAGNARGNAAYVGAGATFLGAGATLAEARYGWKSRQPRSGQKFGSGPVAGTGGRAMSARGTSYEAYR